MNKYLETNYTRVARGMPLHVATNDLVGDLRDYRNPLEIRFIVLPGTIDCYTQYVLNEGRTPEPITKASFIAAGASRDLAKFLQSSSFLETLPTEIRIIGASEKPSILGVFVKPKKQTMNY